MKRDKSLLNCLVAESNNGEIIGFASFFFCYYSWTGKAIYMDDLYVQLTYRAQGIGTRLLQSVYHYGKNEGCNKLRWQVSRWNEKAIGFYKSLGATIDEVEVNCDLPM
jgi:diamine N-acetyltransferase